MSGQQRKLPAKQERRSGGNLALESATTTNSGVKKIPSKSIQEKSSVGAKRKLIIAFNRVSEKFQHIKIGSIKEGKCT